MTAPGDSSRRGDAHNKGELFASFDVDAFEVPHADLRSPCCGGCVACTMGSTVGADHTAGERRA